MFVCYRRLVLAVKDPSIFIRYGSYRIVSEMEREFYWDKLIEI